MKHIIVGLTVIFFSFIILCMFIGKSDAEVDPNSIVAVWLFDEGAGDVAKDSSGNGHDGTIKGGVKRVDGKFNDALDFPGTDRSYVSIPHEDSLSLSEFTVMAWVKLIDTGESHGVVSKMEDLNNKNYLLLVSAAVGMKWFIQASPCDFLLGLSETAVVDGKWHNIAGTYDGKSLRAYTDGVQETIADCNQELNANTAPLLIGARPDGSPVKGIIDDVGLFNEALSDDDIKTLVTQGLRGRLFAVSKKGKLATVWGKIKGEL